MANRRDSIKIIFCDNNFLTTLTSISLLTYQPNHLLLLLTNNKREHNGLTVSGDPRVLGEVSIGANLTFKVIFTPLEYVPTIPPLFSYVINICFVLFKQREGPQHISSAFLTAQILMTQEERGGIVRIQDQMMFKLDVNCR